LCTCNRGVSDEVNDEVTYLERGRALSCSYIVNRVL
jgi:hypothetical protein